VAACLVAPLAPAAEAASYTDSSHSRSIEDPNAKLIEALAARQLQELGIDERFMPFLTGDQQVDTGRWLAGLPAPDMNDDSSPEVIELDVRYSYALGDGQGLPMVNSEVDTRFTVRRGTDGKKVWGKRFDRDAWPMPMRVGEDGRWGVVVISGLWNFYGTTQQSTLTFEAFEGRNGKHLWTREFTSLSYYELFGSVTTDAPLMIGAFDGLEGPADDLMLGLGTWVGGLLGTTVTTRVVVIDGATGAEVAHPMVDVGIDWIPIPLPTKDLDGDGLDDYATTNKYGIDLGEGQETPAIGGTVYTRKGTDGSAIWTTSGIEMELFGFTTSLPDVVGNATPDLALQTYVVSEEQPLPAGLPVALPLLGGWYEDRIYLFEGDHGVERWHRSQHWIYSPGDIDSDGRADVMLGRYWVRFKKGRSYFDQIALRGHGERIWQRRSVWRFETAPCPEDLCWGGWGMGLNVSPDVEPDSVRDVILYQDVQQNEAFRDHITRVYTGRTGRLRFEEEDPLQNAGVAVDGEGTDLLVFKIANNRADMDVRNGRNQKVWDGAFVSEEKILPRRSGFYGTGLYLPGDRCGDLVVNGWEDEQSFYLVLDGAGGRLLWGRTTAPTEQRLRWQPSLDNRSSC
jgi:hypothetical protein